MRRQSAVPARTFKEFTPGAEAGFATSEAVKFRLVGNRPLFAGGM